MAGTGENATPVQHKRHAPRVSWVWSDRCNGLEVALKTAPGTLSRVKGSIYQEAALTQSNTRGRRAERCHKKTEIITKEQTC